MQFQKGSQILAEKFNKCFKEQDNRLDFLSITRTKCSGKKNCHGDFVDSSTENEILWKVVLKSNNSFEFDELFQPYTSLFLTHDCNDIEYIGDPFLYILQLQRTEDVHVVVQPGTYSVTAGSWGQGQQHKHVVHVNQGQSVDLDFCL